MFGSGGGWAGLFCAGRGRLAYLCSVLFGGLVLTLPSNSLTQECLVSTKRISDWVLQPGICIRLAATAKNLHLIALIKNKYIISNFKRENLIRLAPSARSAYLIWCLSHYYKYYWMPPPLAHSAALVPGARRKF